MPKVQPSIYALLAFCVAAAKGTNVDQPRNLAKGVTVEWRAGPSARANECVPAERVETPFSFHP
jgi:hypothetical protein